MLRHSGKLLFKTSATLLLDFFFKGEITQYEHEMKTRYRTWIKSMKMVAKHENEKYENGCKTWISSRSGWQVPSSITDMKIEVIFEKGGRGTIMQRLWNAAKFFALISHIHVFLYHCWPGGKGGGGGGGFGDFAFGGGLALLLLECEPRLEINCKMYFCSWYFLFFIVRFISFYPIHGSSSVIKLWHFHGQHYDRKDKGGHLTES